MSSSSAAVSKLATPTWCPLDKGLGWHLSVSEQPSVAPSISLADSRGPGASLTPSLYRFYTTLPARAFQQHMAERMNANTHTSLLRAIHLGLKESGAERPSHHHDNMTTSDICSPLSHYLFRASFYPSLHFLLHPSPSCLAQRSMVNSCSTWLWDQ